MPWFRLDDEGAFHEKVLEAGNEAYGAWCRAGQWSSNRGTEGFIPLATAHTIAPPKVWKALAAAKAGGEFGLIDDIDPAASGYQIHDFLVYNPTSEETEIRRREVSKRRSEAGKRGAAKRWQKSNLPSTTHAKDDGKSMAIAIRQNDNPIAPIPIPIQEDPPKPPEQKSEPKPDPKHEPRRFVRHEPIIVIGAGSHAALETFEQALIDTTGETPVIAKRGSVVHVLTDIVNAKCRGDGPTQTTLGALAELRRLTIKFVVATRTANAERESQYHTPLTVEAFAKWFARDGHKVEDETPAEPSYEPDVVTATTRLREQQSPEQAARVRDLLSELEPGGRS